MYGRETLFTKIGAIGATGAGVLGLLSLAMTVAAPALYGPDSGGSLALRFDPNARPGYVIHYVVLAVGALFGLIGTWILFQRLRGRASGLGLVALVPTICGLVSFAYASGVRATLSNQSMRELMVVGGSAFLAGVLLFNVALWRTRVAPRWIAGFGLLVTALQAGYLTVILSSVLPGGRMLIPMIWGLTLPPPGDYLLALWFILVGISLMRGRVPSYTDKGGLGSEQ